MVPTPMEWAGVDSAIGRHVTTETERTLNAYRSQPALIEEHVRIEQSVKEGGYGHRQIHELVQNASDAIQEAGRPGNVKLILTQQALYCANEGAPIDQMGATTILGAHLSRKKGAQIGHFGLGFKSVLGVTSVPKFYSRTGSFAFDVQFALHTLRGAFPDAQDAPVLRLGRAADVHADAASDSVLRELMPWATTIVKLDLERDAVDLLALEIEEFPAEFLLFASHVRQLELEDRVDGTTRRIESRRQHDQVILKEGADEVAWRVCDVSLKTAELSREALQDAPQNTRDRDVLPLVWAVPVNGMKARSRFWAFFPTETETTLSGILNAPWKTNSDRQNLLPGDFNRAVIDQAISLIASKWATLSDPGDPGRLLDLMTARADAAKNAADRYLSERLDATLAAMPSVPDARGRLVRPNELYARPEVASRPEAQEWLQANASAEAGLSLVHPSIEQRDRRARALRLGAKALTASQWIQMVAQDRLAQSSTLAIRLTAVLDKLLDVAGRSELLLSEFVLTQSGTLASPKSPHLLLTEGDDDSDAQLVASELVQEPDIVVALEGWGVARPSPEARFKRLLNRGVRGAHGWEQFWQLMSEMSPTYAEKFLASLSVRFPDYIHVRVLSGEWKPCSAVLLPGRVIPVDGSRDQPWVVDTKFHEDTRELLPLLGVSDCPVHKSIASADSLYQRYRRVVARMYREEIPEDQSKPREDLLEFDVTSSEAPLAILEHLSEQGRLAATELLLPLVNEQPVWRMRHSTRTQSYPKKEVASLLIWSLSRTGLLSTSLGPRKPGDATGPALLALSAVLPVASCAPAVAGFLGCKSSFDQLTSEMWQLAFSRCEAIEDLGQIGALYAGAASNVPPPERIRVRTNGGWSLASAADAVVITDEGELESACGHGAKVVLAPDQEGASALEERWGLSRHDVSVQYVAACEESRLDQLVAEVPIPDGYGAQRVQLCDELWYQSSGARGAVKRYVDSAYQHGVIYAKSTLAEGDLVAFVLESAPSAAPDEQGPTDAHTSATARLELETRLRLVRQAQDLAGRLLALLGVDALRSHVPVAVLSELELDGDVNDRDVAKAALAVFGVQVLREYQLELEAIGLSVPQRWSGSTTARVFVEDLGFPQEYAGFESTRLEPTVEVDGPISLNPLHAFQRTVADRIVAKVSAASPGRALVSLPTGAGKTRVAVQALIEAIKGGTLTGCVLWIAQSEELCEQTVQAWRQAWRFLGPAATLRVSRLWGATNNRVVPTRGHAHVVVATFQSLDGRIEREQYRWLREAACVVVDEAHGSVTPAYTRILEALGLKHNLTSRPLIGLTATPFRGGADAEETERLVRRYHGERLDHGIFDGDDHYAALQEIGVLARAEHQELQGATVDLSFEEMAELRRFNVLPPDAARRLGEVVSRNRTIVESIESLPTDWPVLVFTTSVDHAFLLAALLSARGIEAKAISGKTDVGSRRHYIREFRAGRLRVLTNYGVLTTGFDAPSVRALYVTRPVFSRLLYQQMLGRGLRGPLNGGKERCLIVNINDNVAEYGEQLAFRHFEHLWTGPLAEL